MIGKEREVFKLIFTEDYFKDILRSKYRIISKPILTEEGWEYTIEKI